MFGAYSKSLYSSEFCIRTYGFVPLQLPNFQNNLRSSLFQIVGEVGISVKSIP